MRRVIWILWPSFLMAAMANAAFFSLFDPADLYAHLEPSASGAIGIYTLGFFALWALGACSSALTCFLQREANEVNRMWCPLPNDKRPPGCRVPD